MSGVYPRMDRLSTRIASGLSIPLTEHTMKPAILLETRVVCCHKRSTNNTGEHTTPHLASKLCIDPLTQNFRQIKTCHFFTKGLRLSSDSLTGTIDFQSAGTNLSIAKLDLCSVHIAIDRLWSWKGPQLITEDQVIKFTAIQT